jgi:hypothetical protein
VAGRRRRHHRSGHPHRRRHVQNTAGISITSGVRNVSTPGTKALQTANFQQEAFTEYTAGVLASTAPSRSSAFSELLNTSNGQSAFIDFRQDSSATIQAGDGGRGSIPCSDCQGCHH